MKSLKLIFFILITTVIFSCGSDDETVSDTTSPVITLLGDDTINVAFGVPYVDAGATASDNIDGNITASINVSNPVDVNTLGTYTITFNVSDSSGNSTSTIRTVHVIQFFTEEGLIGDWFYSKQTYVDSSDDTIVQVYDECEQQGFYRFSLDGSFVAIWYDSLPPDCTPGSDAVGTWEINNGNELIIYVDPFSSDPVIRYTILELTDTFLEIDTSEVIHHNYFGLLELTR